MKKIVEVTYNAAVSTFSRVNSTVNFLISAFLLRPSNAILVLLVVGVFSLFSALTTSLNFELFGTKHTFGSDLREATILAFSLTYEALIKLIQSYEPASPIGLPLELVTEGIALILILLGKLFPLLLSVAKAIVFGIFAIGLKLIIEILSWLYLAGLAIKAYEYFKPASSSS